MLTVSADDLQQTFGFRAPRGYKPRYNIAPSQSVLTLTTEGPGTAREMIWGLVPAGSPDASWGRRMINARSETIATKASFRTSFEQRRCLVIMDGYYEWQSAEGVRKPHRICLKSREPFTVAGIWDCWEGADGVLESCAILTTSAAGRTAGIHDRMPVLVAPANRDLWLDSIASSGDLKRVMVPYEADDLEAYEVSPLVNSPVNDGPECLQPFTAPPAATGPSGRSGRGSRKAVSSEILDLFLPPEDNA